MTMQHQIHPDDERLAALAGGDPDVVAVTELSAHISGCSRCSEFVDEMATLRTALAELPDLVPSRRLQLIPPVAEPRAASSGGWLRRLAAPVMAAGFGLVLVGAVGTSGILNGLASSPGSQSAAEYFESNDDASIRLNAAGSPAGEKSPVVDRNSATDSAAHESNRTSPPATQPLSGDVDESSSEVAGAPGAGRSQDASGGLFSLTDPRLPWLVILGLGVGLLLAGFYLRVSAQPRAG
jgi:anti-sigma factor RsiW